jgi:poly(beta-D-mannuronate) C5 epimerase
MTTRRKAAGGYAIVAALVLGLGAIGTFVFGRSYSELALQKEAFDRLPYVSSLDPVQDVINGDSPNTTNERIPTVDPAIRVIEVYPTQVILLAGAKGQRIFERPAPATLHGLVRMVHRPGWISEAGHTITLHAAVVLQGGSTLSVAAPVTTRLVMQVRPGVFLAAVRSRLSLAGVDIRASDSNVPRTLSKPDEVAGRPFVLASENATLTASHCSFRYLGRDWNSSYGLTWSKGSTGYVVDSRFEHNFIGMYSNGSSGLRVEHNQFYDNSLYGVDPHSGSSHLTIAYNVANHNGRHGIIFSNHVTDSVVSHNVTRYNGLNGIMMDEASTHNTITDNTVTDNRSAGIVMANSSDNAITDNQVRKNRVGIDVRGTSAGITVDNNTLTGNNMAAQGTELSGNKVYGNGGEWLPGRIGLIWLGDACLLFLLLAATRLSRRRTPLPLY